jgi:alcohol dehydrogenase
MSKKASIPLVAVNTTAGTASECTRAYVILDEETNDKYGSKDKNVMAAIAVDDHELMMGLPKGLTAGTGMDALTHAVECYTSINGYCLTSSLALSAVKLIFKHLEGAVLNPNEEDREGMAAGQYLAGLAFGNAGCGLVHSMSHQLSAIYDLPHGLCNAILLPEIMKFNCKVRTAQIQYGEIAGDLFPLECAGKDDGQKAGLFIEKVETLSDKIGTKIRLISLGVKEEDIGLLAEKALKDSSLGNNPVRPTKEQIEQLFWNML